MGQKLSIVSPELLGIIAVRILKNKDLTQSLLS